MEGITGLITDGFADVTTLALVIIGAVFAFVGMVVAAGMGIAWLRKAAKKS